MIGCVDVQGRFLYVNPACGKTLGYSKEEFANLSLVDLVRPGDREDFLRLFRRVMSGEKIERVEVELTAKSGEMIVLEVSLNCKVVDGKPVSTRCIFRNVTERKQVEAQLADRLRFETLLADLSARFVKVPAEKLDDEIEEAQRRVGECLGVEASSLWLASAEIPRSVLRLTHIYRPMGGPPLPEQIDAREYFPWCYRQIVDMKAKVIAVSSLEELPAEAARDRETWRQLGVRSALVIALSVGGGTPVGALSFNSMGAERTWPEQIVNRLQLVAEMLSSALARQASDRALRESEERFRGLSNASLEGVMIHDQGAILDANAAFAWLFGYERPEEHIGKYGLDSIIAPESRARVLDRLQRHETGLLELTCVRKDGTTFAAETDSRPVWYLGHNASVVSCRDVTERKRAEGERLAHLHLLESMDRVNRAIQGTQDVEQMLDHVLDTVLSVLDCDRAFLLHPCDPEAKTSTVHSERTRPGYPGVLAQGRVIRICEEAAETFRVLLNADGPVEFGLETEHPLPEEVAQRFGVRSSLSMALRPKRGEPWEFGIHQCSHVRVWNAEEERLFEQIGRRLTDALDSLLAYRDLHESEERYRTLFANAPVGIYRTTPEGRTLAANPAFVRLLGYSSFEELAASDLNIECSSHGYPRRRFQEFMERQREVSGLEGTWRRRDGSMVHVRENARVFRDDSGKVLYYEGTVEDITERKRAQEALEQAAKRFKLVTLATHDAVFDWDLVSHEIWRNENYQRLFGAPERALDSDNWWLNRLHAEDRERVLAAQDVALSGGSNLFSTEFRLRRPDGSYADIVERSHIVRDRAGQAVRVIGALTDISARKEAEEALQASEHELAQAMDMASLAHWEYDSATGIFTFNDRFYTLYGTTAEREGGYRLSAEAYAREFVFPEDTHIVVGAKQVVTADPNATWTFEHRIRRRDGEVRHILVRVSVLKDSSGQTIKARGVNQDITERKRAEEALRGAEEKFRKAFNASPDAIAIRTFPEGRYLEVNDAFLRTGRTSREEVIGKTVAELGIWVNREDLKRVHALIERDGRVRDFESRIRRSNGELGYGVLSAERIDLGGQPCLLLVATDITERKHMEQALKDSEKRYREFISHSIDAVWRFECEEPIPLDLPEEELLTRLLRHSVMAECNDAMARLYGLSGPEELIGRSLGDLPIGLDAGRMESYSSGARARFQPRSVTFRTTNAAGKPLCLIRTEVPTIEGGKLIRIWGITRDITELTLAEEALRESEERFRSLVENATVGIYRTAPDGRILMANPALVKMMGFDSLEELARRNLEEEGFEPNYPRSEFKARLEREGEIRGLEEAWVRRDGTTIFVRESARVKRGPNGELLHYDGIVEDITEHRRAEESRRYLASIVESSDDAILGTNCEGVIQSWNRGAERLYGYTAAEMIGQPVSLLASQDQLGEIARLRDWISRGDDVQRYETVQVRNDGSQVDVLTTLSTIKDSRGRVIGASIIAHDITKRKRAQRELERSLEELRALGVRLQNAREEERKRLAREIHDQLGQALTAIKIDLFAWVSQTGGDPQHPPEAASALLQLVDQTIKGVRRIATELRPGILDDLGLVAAIEWAGEDFEARTGIKCRLDLPQENIEINPERATAIFRILQESLTNVVRHAAASEVKIRLQEKDRELTLLVQDNGKGMRMDKLFRSRSLGILGMHERALVFGGEVIIEATPGKGTTVLVRIPQADLT